MRKCAAMVLVLLSVACQGDGSEPHTQERPALVQPSQPCALLTAEEIGEAVGTPSREGEEVSSISGDVRLCTYRTGPPYASITVQVEWPMTQEQFQRRMKKDPINTEEMTGLGDLAFVHAGVSLSVLSRETAVSASVQHFKSVDDTQVMLRSLGETIVSKLQRS